MNWRKAATWTAGAVAAFAASAALAVYTLVDPQRLIDSAREDVRARWQRDLAVGGASLSLFPVPSIDAVKVALGNPPWAREPHLVRAERVRAEIELLPLMVGRLRVRELTLEGVHAGLEEGEDGRVSWELTPAPGDRGAGAAGEEEVLQVAAVTIRDVRVHHRVRNVDAEPLHIREARIEAAPGMRDVRIAAQLARHGQALGVDARLADLSRLGEPGATTEGRVELDWGRTRATLEGTFPLERSLRGHALAGEVKSDSLEDLFAFLAVERGATAPFALRFESREDAGEIALRPLAAKLGALEVRGEARVRPAGKKTTFHARLEAGRLDWLRTLKDSGGIVKPPRRDGEIFHADPVAWRAVTTLGAIDGTAEVKVASLKLGNGIELSKVAAKVEMGGGRLAFEDFSAALLGGRASGSLAFDGRRERVRVELDGRGLLLERWFAERGSKVPFRGGPMRLTAKLALAGGTYRELAASVTGPLTLRMGPGRLDSKRASEAEEMMVRALVASESDEIDFECVAASLDFRDGRARGERLIGARSTVSQLLTAGVVDVREEKLDLRGTLEARKGAAVGVATLAGGVQVTGRLARPRMQLDPDSKPAIIARAGAAIATAGVTLLGETLIRAAAREDPCEAVFQAEG